mmetsp:Transcript_102567/g.316514  ORF Transcript_102567/g.316514 Transcript_102567/m.316514 type:complete len:234 (-) Transcript_102567:163-864(-)
MLLPRLPLRGPRISGAGPSRPSAPGRGGRRAPHSGAAPAGRPHVEAEVVQRLPALEAAPLRPLLLLRALHPAPGPPLRFHGELRRGEELPLLRWFSVLRWDGDGELGFLGLPLPGIPGLLERSRHMVPQLGTTRHRHAVLLLPLPRHQPHIWGSNADRSWDLLHLRDSRRHGRSQRTAKSKRHRLLSRGAIRDQLAAGLSGLQDPLLCAPGGTRSLLPLPPARPGAAFQCRGP